MEQVCSLTWDYSDDLPLYFTGDEGATLEYSKPDGLYVHIQTSTDAKNWTSWAAGTKISLSSTPIYVRNTTPTLSVSAGGVFKFSTSGTNIKAAGNIYSLLNYNDVSGYCFYNLFSNCLGLVQAPDLLATNLAASCYEAMFSNCQNLIKAPKLPATALASRCYYKMFNYCKSLEIAPALPATTLAGNCYDQMFLNCSNLKTLPAIQTAVFPRWSCAEMFKYCSKICLSSYQTSQYKYAYRLPKSGDATIESSSVFDAMFTNTGGTFKGTPQVNTIYYTSNEIIE